MSGQRPGGVPVLLRQARLQVGNGLGTAEQPERAIRRGGSGARELRVTPGRDTALVGQHPIHLDACAGELFAQPVTPGGLSAGVAAPHDQHPLPGPDAGCRNEFRPQRADEIVGEMEMLARFRELRDRIRACVEPLATAPDETLRGGRAFARLLARVSQEAVP